MTQKLRKRWSARPYRVLVASIRHSYFKAVYRVYDRGLERFGLDDDGRFSLSFAAGGERDGQQKNGCIVSISTTLVDHPVAGVPVTLQVMAKGSLNAVTRSLAMEYVKEGIRVNTVALGVIKTPMHKPETYE